ncbi:hypothetical protein [Streptomyces xanthophaeus]|uniref:hypothetical protein n=1 Tax=Streptomyces xanthophaeus TaxID=67385 RepID=UPI0036465B8F
MTVAAVAFGYALHHGEEQDRATRHTNPHAAYWDGRQPRPAAPHTPAWARRRTPAWARPTTRRRRHRR